MVPEPSRVEEPVVSVARAEEAGGPEEALAGVPWQETPAELRRRERERGRTQGIDDPCRPVVDDRVGRVAARDAGPRLDDDEGLRR